ncbi:MAG: MFS transporter, partial [Anaerolineae bacterium]|nr:MFS transporter [Anaerolineae bacterium]
VVAFLLGVAETLVDTSWEAMVPRLVPAEQLEIANGRSQAAEYTSNELLGPPLGGFLFLLAV